MHRCLTCTSLSLPPALLLRNRSVLTAGCFAAQRINSCLVLSSGQEPWNDCVFSLCIAAAQPQQLFHPVHAALLTNLGSGKPDGRPTHDDRTGGQQQPPAPRCPSVYGAAPRSYSRHHWKQKVKKGSFRGSMLNCTSEEKENSGKYHIILFQTPLKPNLAD